MQIDAGEVGSFGYWLAAFDFLGFLVGGAFVYLQLKDELICNDCKKYLHTLSKKKKSFEDAESFATYYDNEFDHPFDSPEFAQHVTQEYAAGKTTKGTISMETKVMSCPSCGSQQVAEKVQIYDGKDWKDFHQLNRLVPIPPGVDVSKLYA